MEFEGLVAVVGALSRNLHDLQDRQGSYLSIYDQPLLENILSTSVIYDF